MTYKKVKVNGCVPIEEADDWFNDLIEEGFSVGEALANIISHSIVISKVNDLEGHVIYLFVVSKNNNINNKILNKIVSNFGTFALPKEIYYINELPKTRSGKILRRLLRSMLINPHSKNYGDLSTMLNSKVIYEIKEKILHNVKN